MLMYLVLFAALALKMRSPTFQGTRFTIKVEVRQILGQVFYFLYYMGCVWVPLFHWKYYIRRAWWGGIWR